MLILENILNCVFCPCWWKMLRGLPCRVHVMWHWWWAGCTVPSTPRTRVPYLGTVYVMGFVLAFCSLSGYNKHSSTLRSSTEKNSTLSVCVKLMFIIKNTYWVSCFCTGYLKMIRFHGRLPFADYITPFFPIKECHYCMCKMGKNWRCLCYLSIHSIYQSLRRNNTNTLPTWSYSASILHAG